MKVFRDISITAPASKIAKFASAISGRLPAHWTRDTKAESRLSSSDPTGKPQFCFRYDGAEYPAAGLWLVQADDGDRLYVSNIVPSDTPQLTVDQYNGILLEFHNAVSSVPGVSDDFSIGLGEEDKAPTDFMSVESVEKLHRFSAAADKTIDVFDPKDKERWMDFVVSVSMEGADINEQQLECLLVEDEGWPRDIADDLVREYAIAREAIKKAAMRLNGGRRA